MMKNLKMAITLAVVATVIGGGFTAALTMTTTAAFAQTLIEYTACVVDPGEGGDSRPQMIIVDNLETQERIDNGELKLVPLQVCFLTTGMR